MSGIIIRPFASRRFTAILVLLLLAAYIYFAFYENPYERWIDFVFHTWPGLALYAVLIFNIMAVSIRAVYIKLAHKAVTPEAMKDMDINISIPNAEALSLDAIQERLRKTGFSTYIKDMALTSTKGRLSFLPGTILRAGIVMLMTAVIFSTHLRSSKEAVVHEAEEEVFFGKGIYLKEIKASLPQEFLEVAGQSTFRLKDVSGDITSSGRAYRVTSGFALRAEGLYFKITHLGFLQPISVKTKDESLQMNAELDVLPPGKTGVITLTGGQKRLFFTLAPEKTISKGLLKGRLYSLRTPLYNIALNDRPALNNVTIKPEGSAELGGVSVSANKGSLFIKIKAVKDPALLWIYGGTLITLTGIVLLPSRFFWYEKRICAVIRGNAVVIGYSEEFYKKWGIQRFQNETSYIRQVISGHEAAINKAESSQ